MRRRCARPAPTAASSSLPSTPRPTCGGRRTSLTTNGQMRSRAVTVIATFNRPGGASAGVVTRSLSTIDEVDDLVRAAETAGREAEPAEDASAARRAVPTPRRLGCACGRDQRRRLRTAGAATRRGVRSLAGRRPAAVRLRRTPADVLLHGELDRVAQALRSAGRPDRGQRQDRRSERAPPGTACTPATSPTSTSRRSPTASNGVWGGPRRSSTCRPAGTRRSCRRRPWPT